MLENKFTYLEPGMLYSGVERLNYVQVVIFKKTETWVANYK